MHSQMSFASLHDLCANMATGVQTDKDHTKHVRSALCDTERDNILTNSQQQSTDSYGEIKISSFTSLITSSDPRDEKSYYLISFVSVGLIHIMDVDGEEVPLNNEDDDNASLVDPPPCTHTPSECFLLNERPQRPPLICDNKVTTSANNKNHNNNVLLTRGSSLQKMHLEMNAMSATSQYDLDYHNEMEMENETLRNVGYNRHHSLDTMDEFDLFNDSEAESSGNETSKMATSTDAANTGSAGHDTVDQSLFFNDKQRPIDFVLVWQSHENPETEEQRKLKRSVFERNLIAEGLQLEEDIVAHIHFVKVHAPVDLLRQYAGILKLRMPMKASLSDVHQRPRFSTITRTKLFLKEKVPALKKAFSKTDSLYMTIKRMWVNCYSVFLVDEKHFPPRSQRFTAIYSRDKEYLFDVNQSGFFTAAIRSRIVQFILDRKKYTTSTDNFAFGIDRLISSEVYIGAYPLHDGDLDTVGSKRHLLSQEWASINRFYRYQPLDYIKDYFGVKIGLYFAWLGYYTYMLMLASIVGLLCLVYSLMTMNSHTPSKDICSGKLDVKMCPLCDYWCDFWELKETCIHARITYLFDNPSTVFFAMFMSFWATLFLEQWKRYSAEITHRWDLTGFDIHEEHPRPQYLARLAHVSKTRLNTITNTEEPQPPFWRMKLPATVFSFSVVILLVALAGAAVFGVVLYRMSVMAALSLSGNAMSTSIIITTATAACINLVLIFAFNYVYTWLATTLTEYELNRTQTQFDDSLTLKIYLLQFVNYYASIFYIAFFKGKFVGYPGKYVRFFNYRQEECGLGGCLMELSIQLTIIMVGKQAMNTVLEMILPRAWKWWNKTRFWKKGEATLAENDRQRWVNDLKLIEWGQSSLFTEYLEMVLQYGFVTIFVAAFPLAPLFALINNILEMRLDAKKLLTHYRRPITQRVKNIGVWYRILDCIGKLSVITNGFIIAFTSDAIPRLVYTLTTSTDGTLNGYLNNSLSYFNTSDFQRGMSPKLLNTHVDVCRYPDHRQPHHPYDRTTMYWTILAARLAFVVLFENIVAVVILFVKWCIPDMAAALRDQIKRESYITNEIIIQQEALKAESILKKSKTADSKEDPCRKHVNHIKASRTSRSSHDLNGIGATNQAPSECCLTMYE